MMILSVHNVAYDTTAVLSWYVQNFELTGRLKSNTSKIYLQVFIYEFA